MTRGSCGVGASGLPKGSPSFSVRGRTRPRSRAHRRMERPHPRDARPAEYRRPASRLARSPIPHHPHNEHPRPGYRTAEPSDKSSAGVALCVDGWARPRPVVAFRSRSAKRAATHPPKSARRRRRVRRRRDRKRSRESRTRSLRRAERSDKCRHAFGGGHFVVAENDPTGSQMPRTSLLLRDALLMVAAAACRQGSRRCRGSRRPARRLSPLTARCDGRSHESVSRSNRERSNLSALISNIVCVLKSVRSGIV